MSLAESARETAEKEVAELREKMTQLQKERDSIEAQSRSDKKVLVKEIKSLRSAQPELKKEAELAQQAKLELEVRFFPLSTRQSSPFSEYSW